MNVIDDIQQFVKQMEGFEDEPIIVKYSRKSNTYCFIQKGKVVYTSIINYLSLPSDDRTMIMSYGDYNSMLNVLSNIVQLCILNQRVDYLFSPSKLGFKIYERGSDTAGYYSGPKLTADIRFYSIKNWFAVRFFLYFYSKDFRKFYQYIKEKGSWNVG